MKENTGKHPKTHRHTHVIKYTGHTSHAWLPQTNATRHDLGVYPYMTTTISITHYTNYSEDETNATNETGNDTSEAKYPIRKTTSTITTLLGVHGNVNNVLSPRHDANDFIIDESNLTRITGEEISKNKYQIDVMKSIGRPRIGVISR